MTIINLIIIVIISAAFFATKKYKQEEITILNKVDHPFILLYPISFIIIDNIHFLKTIKKYMYLEKVKIISIVIFMICVSNILCILLIIVENGDREIDKTVVKRPDFVENSQKFELDVYKEGKDTPLKLEFSLEPRKYTVEELNQNFILAYDYLLENILNQNQSLEMVNSNLNLITNVSQYGMNVDWYSSNYNVVSYDGTVYNSDLKQGEEYISIQLIANLKYQEVSCEFPIDLKVIPPYLSEEDLFLKAIESAILEEEDKHRYEEMINLPQAVNGVPVKYKTQSNNTLSLVLMLSAIVTVILLLDLENQKQKNKKFRIKQLKYDYSEVISKLTLLSGAGMTISRAWEKISIDYKAQRLNNRCKLHYVYEEMLITYYQMKSGISEGKAYAEFGIRCNMKEYLKLGALLEQNLKKGTKGLSQILENESFQAFEERKNIAKRLGEEAGTKLLVPMGIMLVIVMIIVIFPAFLSFNI